MSNYCWMISLAKCQLSLLKNALMLLVTVVFLRKWAGTIILHCHAFLANVMGHIECPCLAAWSLRCTCLCSFFRWLTNRTCHLLSASLCRSKALLQLLASSAAYLAEFKSLSWRNKGLIRSTWFACGEGCSSKPLTASWNVHLTLDYQCVWASLNVHALTTRP